MKPVHHILQGHDLSRAFRGVVLGLTALVLFAAPALAQQPTAKEVIQKYVDATGGKETLQGLKSMKIQGSMEIVSAGIALDLTMYATKDAYLMTVEVPGAGEAQQGYKGDLAWSVQNGEARKLEGEEKQQILNSTRFDEPLRWLEYDGEITVVGEEAVNGKPAWHLTFAPKSGPKAERYFDKETGLQVQSKTTLITPQGEVKGVQTYEDYKDFDGVKMPTKQRQTIIDLADFVVTYDEVKFNVDIPADTFDPPAGIQ